MPPQSPPLPNDLQCSAAQSHFAWLALPVLFSLILLTIAIAYGFQYRVEDAHITRYFTVATLIAGAFLAAFTVLAMRSAGRPALPRAQPHPQALATGLTLLSLICSVYFYSGPAALPTIVLLAGLTGVSLALAAIRHLDWALWFLAASGTALFVYLGLATPINVDAANMLPVIAASCDSIAVGENPFGRIYPGISSVMMYYLPLHVLPYCPFEWSGVDLRWLNIILFVALMFVIGHRFDFRNRPEIIGLTFLPLLFSPMSFQMSYYGHVWSYWLIATLLAIALADRRYAAATVILGFMLLTRQTTLFVAGMVGAAFVVRLGWAPTLRYAAIAGGMFVAGMLLTQVYSGFPAQNFYLGIKVASQAIQTVATTPFDQISLSGRVLELSAGTRPYMMYIQAGLAGALCLPLLRSGGLHQWQTVVLVGIGYIVTMSLSVFLHRYFYGSGLLIVASGLAVALQGQAEVTGQKRS